MQPKFETSLMHLPPTKHSRRNKSQPLYASPNLFPQIKSQTLVCMAFQLDNQDVPWEGTIFLPDLFLLATKQRVQTLGFV